MIRKEILAKALDTYGLKLQVDICIEEMSELTKALLKYRRVKPGQGNLQDAHDSIIEEIADVQITIDQMKMAFGETAGMEEYKLHRLEERMKEAEEPSCNT